jgi:hypothetical protein
VPGTIERTKHPKSKQQNAHATSEPFGTYRLLCLLFVNRNRTTVPVTLVAGGREQTNTEWMYSTQNLGSISECEKARP